jgi:hypothetical protein
MVLKKFRDNYLLTNTPGKTFVAAYYKLSPPLAAFIARHEALRFGVRLFLAPLIFAVEHPGFALVSLMGCTVAAIMAVIRLRMKRINRSEPA